MLKLLVLFLSHESCYAVPSETFLDKDYPKIIYSDIKGSRNQRKVLLLNVSYKRLLHMLQMIKYSETSSI